MAARSFVKWIGESGIWKRIGRVHVALYRRTRGRLGGRLAGLPHLLLTTTGRRSAQPRTVPLSYMPDREDFVLVASNGGSDRPPVWWLNLEHTPEATIQVGAEEFPVVASRAYVKAHAPDIFLGDHYEAVVYLAPEVLGDNWLATAGTLKLYFNLDGDFVSEDRYPPRRSED